MITPLASCSVAVVKNYRERRRKDKKPEPRCRKRFSVSRAASIGTWGVEIPRRAQRANTGNLIKRMETIMMRALPETSLALSNLLRFFLVAGLLLRRTSPWQGNWLEAFCEFDKKPARRLFPWYLGAIERSSGSLWWSGMLPCGLILIDSNVLMRSGILGNLAGKSRIPESVSALESYFDVKWQGNGSTWREADLWRLLFWRGRRHPETN